MFVTRAFALSLLLLGFALQAHAANYRVHGEYIDGTRPVYIATLLLKEQPKNVAELHQAKTPAEMRFTFNNSEYPIRSFIRHIGSWTVIGNKQNNKFANEVRPESIAVIYALKDQIHQQLKRREFRKGDDFSIIAISSNQTEIRINTQLLETVNDPAFYHYLLNMWVGASAASPQIRESLLRPELKSPAYQQLATDYQLFHPTEKITPVVKAATVVTPKKTPITKPVAKKAPAPSSKTPVAVNTQEETLSLSPKKTVAVASKTTEKTATIAVVKTPPIEKPVTIAAATPENTKAVNTSKTVINAPNETPKNNQPIVLARIKPSLAVTMAADYQPIILPDNEVLTQTMQRLSQSLKTLDSQFSFAGIDSIVIYCTEQGEILSAQADSTKPIKRLRQQQIDYGAKSISPIAISEQMKKKGIYALRLAIKS